jgi:hypothetical protein
MEIVVPQTAVSVSPGVETRVRIQVANRGDAVVPVRIGLARGRVSAWAQAEPSVVSAGPGESTGVDLVFRPPATATPASTLQPFTVQAEDMRDGSVTARATGLLAVAAPVRLTADLLVVRTRRRKVEIRLTLVNTGESAMTVRVRPTVETVGDPVPRGTGAKDRAARKAARKAERRVVAKPSVVDLPAGQDGWSQIVAKPRRAFIGTKRPFVVTVRCLDAADDVVAELDVSGLSALPKSAFSSSDPTGLSTALPGVASAIDDTAGDEPAAPLATVTHAGIARPRMARATATIIGLLLVAGLTGGAVWLGRSGELPDQIRRRLPGQTQTEDPVSVPFALVDVFPKTGGNGGLPVAEAARDRLNNAGMQVRVVDSTKSRLLYDGDTGFWVLLRDGFVSPEAVDAFCRQYRVIAPNCQVVLD